MLRTAICLTSLFSLVTISAASANQIPLNKQEIQQQIATASIPFVANQGQTDSQVKFYAQTLVGNVFVACGRVRLYIPCRRRIEPSMPPCVKLSAAVYKVWSEKICRLSQ